MMIALYIVIGALAGVISGMGIGGGVILIPALVFFASIPQHGAQAINLLYFLPTAVAALIVHIRNKRIRKDVLLPLIIGGLTGAVGGSLLANRLSGEMLQTIFGYFLLIMGGMEIWKGWKQKGGKKPGGGNSAKRGADGGDPAREGAYAGAGGPRDRQDHSDHAQDRSSDSGV